MMDAQKALEALDVLRGFAMGSASMPLKEVIKRDKIIRTALQNAEKVSGAMELLARKNLIIDSFLDKNAGLVKALEFIAGTKYRNVSTLDFEITVAAEKALQAFSGREG